MKCYWKSGGGITFKVTEGFSDRHLELPCGKCIGCRLAKIRGWGIRCVHEAQMHEASCFITLTYDEENLPEGGSLDVRDWQLFAKRLRKGVGPFRFFACGEYGSKLGRPHMHAILFGVDFAEDRKEWSRKEDKVLWKSDTLEKAWTAGESMIGRCDYDSAAYVAGYAMKKIGGKMAEDHYRRVDTETGEIFWIKPEWMTSSRGGKTGLGGIGSSWYEKFKSDVYPADEVIMKGQRWRPPVFYDRKPEAEDPELWQLIRDRRTLVALEQRENGTFERLRVREVCAEAKMNQKSGREMD